MKENEFLFRITLNGIEFGSGSNSSRDYDGKVGNTSFSSSSSRKGNRRPSNIHHIDRHILDDEKDRHTIRRMVERKDTLQFYLPPSLQPGYDTLPSNLIPEDIAHPILPLLQCIQSKNFVRLLSALLCEVKIIFVSSCTTRLSLCVRAASSILAQGLLNWEHTCIPIVPANILKSVLCGSGNAESSSSSSRPYLVGILNNHASKVRHLLGNSVLDVLYIQLDTNEVMTLNMANPKWTVPDLLKKTGSNIIIGGGGGGGNNGGGSNQSQKTASECLANDLDEILKAEQQALSGQEIATTGGGSGTSNGKRSDNTTPTTPVVSTPSDGKYPRRKSQSSTGTAVRYMSLLERREYASSVDAAAAFGKLIRSSFFVDADSGGNNNDALEDDEDGRKKDQRRRQVLSPTLPLYSSTSNNDNDISSFVASSLVSENEHGEECIRSALASYFVHMYGDMGMYLSESRGSFLLDRRKFLLRKEQLGEREGSPTHQMLQRLTSSRMFAMHARRRVNDMSLMVRDRSNNMPRKLFAFL